MSYLKKIAHKLRHFSRSVSSKGDAERRRMLFETLEKRLLLSADPVAISQDLQDQEHLLPDSVSAVEVDTKATETENVDSRGDTPPEPVDSEAVNIDSNELPVIEGGRHFKG